MSKTEVATNGAASVPALSADMDLLFSSRGAGMSNVRAEDMAIPFLAIIQSGSPQRKKQDGAYINGADEGMAFNTVTQELYKLTEEPVAVVLCGFKKKLLHWKPREDGGGMLGQYDIDDPIAKTGERKGGRVLLDDGTYLVETAEHYCLVVSKDGSAKRIVVAMASTQLKKSRRWLTMVAEKQIQNPTTGQFFNPPSFAYTYMLSSQPEKNDQGDWHGWRISEGRPLNLADGGDKGLFLMALEFQKSIDKGEVETSSARGDDVPASANTGSSGIGADEIPF